MFDNIVIMLNLKKKLNAEIYSGLSYRVKTDSRIIRHLIECDASLISLVPSSVDISLYVSENYNLIVYLTEEQLNDCIGKIDVSKINLTKDLFDKLDRYNQMVLFKVYPAQCIEYMNNENRKEALSGIILAKYASTERDRLHNMYNNRYSSFSEFSDEELKRIVLGLSPVEFKDLFYCKLIVQQYIIDMLLSLESEELEDKYSLLETIYDKLPEVLKDRVDLHVAGDNLEKILSLPKHLQVNYFLKNPDKLICASTGVIEMYLIESGEINADVLLKYNMVSNISLVSKLSKKEREKLFSRNFLHVYAYTHRGNGTLVLDEIINDRIFQISDEDKRNKLLELYNSLSEKQILADDPYIYWREKYQISRMLYDSNIVNNNSVELLTKYKDTYDRNVLIEILSNAYGNHVVEIFNERPNLDLLNIDNFKVFDKKIYEKLGKGFVHYLLNCDLGILNDLISKFTEDEKYLDVFVSYFKCLTNDLENLDLNMVTDLIKKFKFFDKVISEIDFNNIDEITKRNLRILINDDIMLSMGVSSLEELNKYPEIRKTRFIEIGNEVKHVSDMKNLILSYVFGRSVSNDEILEKLSFDKALSVFNIDHIVNNEEIINKIGLTKEEVAMLLLLHEINRIRNLEVLKDTYNSLINRELDVVLFASTFDKIKNYYIEDIKKELLSSADLEKMPKDTIDGVEVIRFAGEEFTLICSATGLNLSKPNSRADYKKGSELLNDWLTREGGVNTISTALVSSDTNVYPVNIEEWCFVSGSVMFVFDNSVDILGVGATDISSEHRERSSTHYFEFIGVGGRDNAFSTMSELKDRINDNRRKGYSKNMFESEITIARREEDVRVADGGIGRAMPIAMYVIGEIKSEHLETARIFNEYYEANGLGKFRIIQVDPKYYRGEGRIAGASFDTKGVENNGRNIR